MNTAKTGLIRVSLKACESLVDGIAKMNLNELKDQPEVIKSLKSQLAEENNQLKQEIDEMKSKIDKIQDKFQKNVCSEDYPLRTPQTLSTTKLSGDALLKNHANKNEIKDANDSVAAATPANKEEQQVAKDVKTGNKEGKNKEAKPKGAKQQQAKVPENDKIDSSRLRFLVGKVIEVIRHPDAEKLYVEKIDLGEERPRTVVSGLVDFIDQDKFQNKLVVALCNLKPAKLRGVLSEAMVMCASDRENSKF